MTSEEIQTSYNNITIEINKNMNKREEYETFRSENPIEYRYYCILLVAYLFFLLPELLKILLNPCLIIAGLEGHSEELSYIGSNISSYIKKNLGEIEKISENYKRFIEIVF